jgi:hypothetical protein
MYFFAGVQMAVVRGRGHRPRGSVPEAKPRVQGLEGPAVQAKPKIAGACHLQKQIRSALRY